MISNSSLLTMTYAEPDFEMAIALASMSGRYEMLLLNFGVDLIDNVELINSLSRTAHIGLYSTFFEVCSVG